MTDSLAGTLFADGLDCALNIRLAARETRKEADRMERKADRLDSKASDLRALARLLRISSANGAGGGVA